MFIRPAGICCIKWTLDFVQERVSSSDGREDWQIKLGPCVKLLTLAAVVLDFIL